MPKRTPEEQREYQRQWSRDKFSDPEARAKRKKLKQEWVERNKDQVNDYTRSWRQTQVGKSVAKRTRISKRMRRRLWMNELKASLGCSRCSENHPAALDFHHLDPTTKKYAISRMVGLTTSQESILEEAKKCIVLCANCHRKLHWELEQAAIVQR